ncbi:hypothetical protein [Bradyrhizobium sp. I1.7.5]|uniref:hypothetical protein n=1 Tax=Bradyrhizobium sp. I1.7.5 TaxID=3156363 RepID=UPI003391C674
MGQFDFLIEQSITDQLEEDTGPTSQLQVFASKMAASARKGACTDAAAFVQVVSKAIYLRGAYRLQIGMSPAKQVALHDLKRVLVGDGWTREGRNHGPFALPANSFLDTGLKPAFRDGGNQIQHAMAGIYLGFVFGFFAEKYVIWDEDSDVDKRLYRATFNIGNELKASQIINLPRMIMADLCA